MIDHGLGSLEVAVRHGVPIGFGTDLLGETHPFQAHELVIRARAMAPLDVLRSATVVNAALLERTGELGIVAPGALADLLAVEGNPLADLALLDGQGERLALIMRGGEIVHRSGV